MGFFVFHNINRDYFPKQRDREPGIIVEVKIKHLVESERRFISEGGRKSNLLEGTHEMPARPSDKDRMGVKTLRW
jgi:hypothetical protein